MISLYTGTPGSGKSLDVARITRSRLKYGFNVIGTMYVNKDMVSGYKGRYYFVDIYSMRPADFIEYSRKYLKKGKEGQCLIVIDECQRIFNSRDWNKTDRRAWNDFFQVHRHFGYNVLLITQYDRLIDRQLRALVEYEYIHRKVSNFGVKGFILSCLAGGKLFIVVSQWYPLKERTGVQFFVYRKRLSAFYDSYMAFDDNTTAGFNELLPLLADGCTDIVDNDIATVEKTEERLVLDLIAGDSQNVSVCGRNGGKGAP